MTDNIEPIRNHSGQFIKGRSGNPTGRSNPAFVRDAAGNRLLLSDLYAQNAQKVFTVLLKLIGNDDTPPGVRVNAIKEFNNRALGQAEQTMITRSTSERPNDIDLSEIDDETLAAVAKLQQAIGLKSVD